MFEKIQSFRHTYTYMQLRRFPITICKKLNKRASNERIAARGLDHFAASRKHESSRKSMGTSGAMRVRSRSQFSEDTHRVQRLVGVRDGVPNTARSSRLNLRRVLQDDVAIKTRWDRFFHQPDRPWTRPDAYTHGVQLPGAQVCVDLRVRLPFYAHRQANQTAG